MERIQRCLTNNLYSSLITAAKNVVECLVTFAIGDSSAKMTLQQGLNELSKRLETNRQCRLPFEFLDYHLMSKLRILHPSTH